MKQHWQYLKYVMRHKWFVLLAGLKLDVPLWTLLLHDWDKFLPDEWFAYRRRFSEDGGYQEQIDKASLDPRYRMAWHLHQKRNKHHWQWWLTPREDGLFRLLPMSDKYRREMLADMRGTGRASTGGDNILEWYQSNKDKMQLHPDTRLWIEEQLGISADEQESSE